MDRLEQDCFQLLIVSRWGIREIKYICVVRVRQRDQYVFSLPVLFPVNTSCFAIRSRARVFCVCKRWSRPAVYLMEKLTQADYVTGGFPSETSSTWLFLWCEHAAETCGHEHFIYIHGKYSLYQFTVISHNNKWEKKTIWGKNDHIMSTHMAIMFHGGKYVSYTQCLYLIIITFGLIQWPHLWRFKMIFNFWKNKMLREVSHGR